LKLSKKWLVIEPDFDQLPAADDVLKHLSDGNNICVLFAKKQSTNKNIKNWLYRLGLNLSKTTALAIAEDVHPKWEDGLFRRRGYGLIKDTRVVTIPSSTGMLKGQVSDSMLQTYTVRPTNFPRTSGIFLVGFSSDQFSDDVVGDVWEGIYPSSVGKLRERQLASRISGVEGGNVFPEDLFIPKTNSKYLEKLDKFALIKDGFLKIKGEVVDVSVSGNDGMYEPWIFDIWNRVGALLSTSCPTKKMVTRCEKRLLDSNALEWIVTRVDKGGKLVAVELLHERRFSNIGASWNVVFSD
jgi:hypothetical protein